MKVTPPGRFYGKQQLVVKPTLRPWRKHFHANVVMYYGVIMKLGWITKYRKVCLMCDITIVLDLINLHVDVIYDLLNGPTLPQ